MSLDTFEPVDYSPDEMYTTASLELKLPLPEAASFDESFWEEIPGVSIWHLVVPKPVALEGHKVELKPSAFARQFEVWLDGILIAETYRSGAIAFEHGPGTKKAWRIRGKPAHDKYLSPWDAANGYSLQVVRGELTPGCFPVDKKWKLEEYLGKRLSREEFVAAMEERQWIMPDGSKCLKPGLAFEFTRGRFVLKP